MSLFEHSKSKFALNLIEARKNAGLNGGEVAKLLNKASHSSVAMWENDKSLPMLDDFVELCKLYKTTPNKLLEFKEI